MAHNHGTASNTPEVFSTFIGCKVKGVFAYYNGRQHRVLVFECGWGLAFCESTGASWTMNPEDVKSHLDRCKTDLARTRKELEGILSWAGEEK